MNNMDKLGDIELFVSVVKNNGFAAAGRQLGLSPASMSARIKNMEQRYGVRLLNRTTRAVAMTEAGREFYQSCVEILTEFNQAEEKLLTGRESIAGPLRITSTSDLGQQHISLLLSEFVKKHPAVTPCLHLSDGVLDIIEEGFDLAIRYGVLSDNRLVARKLATNRRVLCASPEYLKRKGTPKTPDELIHHDCLTMVRAAEPLIRWHFKTEKGVNTVMIQPTRSTNDGALTRQWALEGAGIALKSIWDIKADLKAKRLVTLLDQFTHDFERQGTSDGADLHLVYPNREFLPFRTRAFMDVLMHYFSDQNFASDLGLV